MVYSLLKLYARLAIKIYCRKITINQPQNLQLKGPLLLAANHPNSFLDGVILTILFKNRIYSLARGDVFKKGRVNKILRWLNLLPVYRQSEGAENLSHNYTTFSACHEAFTQNEIVLIFSEGYCKNEWNLRPLKKGTARLAMSTWQKNIPLTVLPVGINYSNFYRFGKDIHINFGAPLDKDSILQQKTEGLQLSVFNEQLEQQLEQAVYKINDNKYQVWKEQFCKKPSLLKRIILALPALLGVLFHAPLYYGAKLFAQKFEVEHFDSVVLGLLFVIYPFYVLLLVITFYIVFGWFIAFFIPLLLPFGAWAYVQLKPLS